MCGIIGLLKLNSDSASINELVAGLKKMEYRGYDSWGYAFCDETGLKIEKKVGRITASSLQGNAAVLIGHTRWATHGAVTEANAHPHLDCKGKIAIVHNGIIDNYLELKEELMKKNHIFKSQTDSEVVAHLFEEAHGNLYERAKHIAPRLHGSFALVIIDNEFKNEIVAIKNESPLCIGVSEKNNKNYEIIFASDPLAFLDKTSEVIYLDEGDIAYARKVDNSKIDLKFFNISQQKEVNKKPATMQWKGINTELADYPHYMLKEIFEQPQTLLAGMNIEAAQSFADAIKGKKVVAIACGTARHAGVIGKHLLQRIAHFSIDAMMAHEFSYFIDDLDKNTILLAISQSGETADVLECVRKAKKRGIKVYSIVNVPSSTLARESENVFYINCGPEIAVASTKAFTNQVLAFYLIAYALANKLNIAEKKLKELIKKINDSINYFDQKAREIAQYIHKKQHVYMIGRGVNFPIALEGSLKLKEVSYIHAEGMPAGELKHGTLALIEKSVPVILLAPNDYTYNDSISNGLETKARGAYLIGISDKPHPSFNIWIQLPELAKDDDVLYPLLEIIPLQLIAYHTAVLLGRDVDKPRNLAKAVTVK